MTDMGDHTGWSPEQERSMNTPSSDGTALTSPMDVQLPPAKAQKVIAAVNPKGGASSSSGAQPTRSGRVVETSVVA